MAEMPDNSVDAVVCDPPYHLTSIVERFGKEDAAPVRTPEGGTGAYARAARGFMGQTWDGGDVAFRLETWREVLRVLKPGGYLLAFSGSRTYHRMTCAIEDAGFEIRDQIMWVYGSGFPKSLDVSKTIDRAAGVEREVVGERKTFKGQGRAEFDQLAGSEATVVPVTVPATDAARQWSGWGTALKPAHEPICMARKPLIGTVAANVLAHGTGAINVDGCRVGTESTVRPNGPIGFHGGGSGGVGGSDAGRWPANFIHDGSDEATAGLGEAARFFYCAKASRSDREDGLHGERCPHPTVKPTDLMRYLCRMVTPPGGTVLDPFMGSGSTGRGAVLEGFNFIGIEMNEDYLAIARARINAVIPPLLRGAP
jgi:site-specific DNA-methyltransferase (adenine-specific)